MLQRSPGCLVIDEPSQVGAARRFIVKLASELGFNETRRGEIAIVVTEIGNNVLRHAVRGEIFWRAIEIGSQGIEVTAVDKGPGMASTAQCLRDGFSTAGTSGNGMGAIARLSNTLDLYSARGEGTVLLAHIAKAPAPAPLELSTYGVISRPKPGQEVCGDSWAVERVGLRRTFFVADGLGHGSEAAKASQDAVLAFRRSKERRPGEIVEAVHAALRGTRGAAVAVAQIDRQTNTLCFAGIGNITATLCGPDASQSMISHNGIVGYQIRKVQEFEYSIASAALLILHSDGLSSRWQMESYPGLAPRHPGLIAGALYRDFSRETDDATILVARLHGSQEAA